MAAVPWKTSTDIIETVKRMISFPIAQNTFSEEDILKFANEEIAVAQVPSILQYNEEYFVTSMRVAIEADKSRYEIPERAIGSKLRDLFYVDASGNLSEMTRISPDDKDFYQRNSGSGQNIHKFYIQGNDIIIASTVGSNPPVGFLEFEIYIRPNQLVTNDRAAIIQTFNKKITITNGSLVAGDTVTIDGTVFTAVAAAPTGTEFLIGATSIDTATNLATVINTTDVATATNGTPSSAVVTVKFTTLSASQDIQSSNSTALTLSSSTIQIIEFVSVPSHLTSGTYIDFLQTKPGHKLRAMDVKIPASGVSDTEISFTLSDVPTDLIVGDYICEINECIIPQIPTDIHTTLCERTSARLQASMGDKEGLGVTNTKIQESETRQGTMLDNRVEGAPQKITNRHSLLRTSIIGSRRRL